MTARNLLGQLTQVNILENGLSLESTGLRNKYTV